MTETPVISADTVPTGGRGALGRRRLRQGRPVGALRRIHRRRIDRPVGGDAQRVDLAVRRIEQHERLAGGVDAEEAPGRRGAGQQLAIAGERQGHDVGGVGLVERRAVAVGRDLVDDALVAGRREDVARPCRRRATRCTCRQDRRTSSTCRRPRRDRCGRRERCRRRARHSGQARARGLRARRHRRTS